MRKAALILPLLAAAPAFAPAFAQDRPPAIFPTRDVTVTYRMQSEGQAQQTSMAFLAAQRLMRMDMGQQGYMVVDQRAGSGFMVMTQQRMIMDMPAGQNPAARIGRESTTARFTREGSERIANTPCTVWRVEDQGEAARICVTADGVSLRMASVNGQAVMEATQVDYAAQDPSRFVRPAGFQALQLPAGVADMMTRQGAGAPNGAPGAAPGGAPFPSRGSALPPPGVTK